MNKFGQISFFALITLLLFTVILGIFLTEIKKMQNIQTELQNKEDTKKNFDLKAIENSAKKSNLIEPNSGPFILENDNNILGHYG